MTPQELADANIKTIRSAARSAPANGIQEPIILVFDMSDSHTADLATHCFRGECPKTPVAVWAKPLDLTKNWLIRQCEDGERLAGEVKAPENAAQIKAIVFNADGATLMDLL